MFLVTVPEAKSIRRVVGVLNLQKESQMDTSGIEPDTSRMLSERDKPTTPCALALHVDFQLFDRRSWVLTTLTSFLTFLTPVFIRP